MLVLAPPPPLDIVSLQGTSEGDNDSTSPSLNPHEAHSKPLLIYTAALAPLS